MQRLNTQTGFVAAANAEIAQDLEHKAAYVKRQQSLDVLRLVANEHDDRIAALEVAEPTLPFPLRGYS